MATSSSLNDQQAKSFEEFSIIWLDANLRENRTTEQKLRSIINQLKKFEDSLFSNVLRWSWTKKRSSEQIYKYNKSNFTISTDH